MFYYDIFKEISKLISYNISKVAKNLTCFVILYFGKETWQRCFRLVIYSFVLALVNAVLTTVRVCARVRYMLADILALSVQDLLFTSKKRMSGDIHKDACQNIFHWKRKRVSEKVYKNRLRMVEAGKKLTELRRKKYNLQSSAIETDEACWASNVQGRRIIHLRTLGNALICCNCVSVLSLQNIESEKRSGLASQFSIRCRTYLITNLVPSDTVHDSSTFDKTRFYVNSRMVLDK